MADKEVDTAMAEMAKTAQETAGQQTGACVYNAGGKTYCAVLAKKECDVLKGIWVAGKKC